MSHASFSVYNLIEYSKKSSSLLDILDTLDAGAAIICLAMMSTP